MSIIMNLLISAIAVFATAYVLPGVILDDFITALVVAVILGVLNTFLKPILVFLTLPITLVTLGLFLFVINVVMVLIVEALVPGFHIDGILWAIIFSVLLSLITSFLNKLT